MHGADLEQIKEAENEDANVKTTEVSPEKGDSLEQLTNMLKSAPDAGEKPV